MNVYSWNFSGLMLDDNWPILGIQYGWSCFFLPRLFNPVIPLSCFSPCLAPSCPVVLNKAKLDKSLIFFGAWLGLNTNFIRVQYPLELDLVLDHLSSSPGYKHILWSCINWTMSIYICELCLVHNIVINKSKVLLNINYKQLHWKKFDDYNRLL